MGLTAKEWAAVSSQGGELLGPDWGVVGRGRGMKVMHVPVEWWAQYIYHDNTRIGEFVAWGGLLAKPLPNGLLIGDDGHHRQSVRRAVGDAEKFKTMKSVRDPSALAKFTEFVDGDKFARSRDVKRFHLRYEMLYEKQKSEGKAAEIYRFETRRMLVVLRVFLGTRPLDELIANVQWILEEDLSADAFGGRRSGFPNEDWNERFYPELLSYLEAADRPGMEQLLLETRRENLAELEVPDEFIADVVVPEPEVAW